MNTPPTPSPDKLIPGISPDMSVQYFESSLGNSTSDHSYNPTCDFGNIFKDHTIDESFFSSYDDNDIIYINRKIEEAIKNADKEKPIFSKMFAQVTFQGPIDFNRFGNGITNMSSMFYKCNFTGPVFFETLDTSAVTNMDSMFHSTTFSQPPDFTDFKTKKVTTMKRMFKYSNLVTIDLSKWNISKVKDMSEMFSHLPAFNQQIPVSWSETSKHMFRMFYQSTAFNNGDNPLPEFPNCDKSEWLIGTQKRKLALQELQLFTDNVCPRCFTVYDELDNIGQWKCSYHPSPPIGGKFPCCGTLLKKRKRSIVEQYEFHIPKRGQYKIINGHRMFVPYVLEKGCTPCDHGSNLRPINVQRFIAVADYIDKDKVNPNAISHTGGTTKILRRNPVSPM